MRARIGGRLLLVWSMIAGACCCGGALPRLQAQEADHQKIMHNIQSSNDPMAVWQRYPVLGVPWTRTAPTIDGQVDKREWSFAARTAGMIDNATGMAIEDTSAILIGYSDSHLYIAWIMAMPQGVEPTADDFIELNLDVKNQHLRYLSLAGTVEGLKWTGEAPGLNRSAWQPKLQYQASRTADGWQAEVAIPWSELGYQAAPQPGSIWNADFARVEKSGTPRIATWTFRGKNWHAIKNFGHMVFTGQPVAVQVERCGWILQEGKSGARLRIYNFSDAPVTLSTAMEVRRADQPVDLAYYPFIESAMAEELPAAIGSPLRQEVNRTLEAYPALKTLSEPLTIPPQQSRVVDLTHDDEAGNYLSGFLIAREGQILAGGMTPFTVTVPMSIKLNSYLLSAQTLECQVDLRRAADKITPTTQVDVTIVDATGKLVATLGGPAKPPAFDGAANFTPQFDTAYTVKAVLRDQGKELASNQAQLQLPTKPQWFGNNLGKKVFVPEPWTDVQASDNKTSMFSTVYDWSKDSLFPRFTVFGKDIMASPIELRIADGGGQVLPLKITKWSIAEQDVEHVVYALTAELGTAATIEGAITVEFDSLAWYRLKITPKGRSLDLSSASLQIAPKAEYSRLYTTGENKAGPIPAEGHQAAFTFAYWIGGYEGGVQFFAENERHWFNASPKRVAQFARGGDGNVLNVNFIDKPVSLTQPIEWNFGWMPTPTRVPPKGWGNFAFYQVGNFALPPEAPASPELQKADPNKAYDLNNQYHYFNGPNWQSDKKLIDSVIVFSYWPELFGYPGTYKPETQQAFKAYRQWLNRDNLKLVVYAGWGMNYSAPEWKDFGTDMIRLPLMNSGYGTYRQCTTTLWQDWFIYKTAEMIRDYDIDGLFIDSTTSLIRSENYTEGMRWIDDQHNVRGSFPLLASRQWLKRIYKLWHGEMKPTGRIYVHNSPPANMAIDGFADIRCPSEFAQNYDGPMDQNFVDYFVAKNGGIPFGLFIDLTNKDWMGDWAKKRSNQLYAVALPMNVSYKAIALQLPRAAHGSYALDAAAHHHIWAARQWADVEHAQYAPWWRDHGMLSTVPADAQVIHAVWLHKGQKALLVVSNLADKPRTIDVQLNTAALGFSQMVATDAITGENVPVRDGRLSLPIDFERYRLLRLEPQ